MGGWRYRLSYWRHSWLGETDVPPKVRSSLVRRLGVLKGQQKPFAVVGAVWPGRAIFRPT